MPITCTISAKHIQKLAIFRARNINERVIVWTWHFDQCRKFVGGLYFFFRKKFSNLLSTWAPLKKLWHSFKRVERNLRSILFLYYIDKINGISVCRVPVIESLCIGRLQESLMIVIALKFRLNGIRLFCIVCIS